LCGRLLRSVPIKPISGNRGICRLDILLLFNGQSKRLSDLLRLAEAFDDFEVEDDQDSAVISAHVILRKGD
jgi:hypothetical protein